MIVRRIGAVSCAKIVGVIYGLLGLVFGGVISLISLIGFSANNSEPPGLLFGMGAIVLLPVIYGGGGFVMTLIGVSLYNVVAARLGGIEMDVE
jgi:hypothetical protein